jgi:subtilisin family serine protease
VKPNKAKKVLDNLLSRSNAKPKNYYKYISTGASVYGVDNKTLKKILKDKSVKSVTQDAMVYAIGSGQQAAPSSGTQYYYWGLDNIAAPTSDNLYVWTTDGAGVKIFDLDTGITATHAEFDGGRATCGTWFIESDCIDYHGHGTATASNAAGKNYGTAKKASIIAVKVLGADGSGSFSGVLAGVDWVIGLRQGGDNAPMVINMSLGGAGVWTPISDAITRAFQNNIVVTVSAGNSNQDVSSFV